MMLIVALVMLAAAPSLGQPVGDANSALVPANQRGEFTARAMRLVAGVEKDQTKNGVQSKAAKSGAETSIKSTSTNPSAELTTDSSKASTRALSRKGASDSRKMRAGSGDQSLEDSFDSVNTYVVKFIKGLETLSTDDESDQPLSAKVEALLSGKQQGDSGSKRGFAGREADEETERAGSEDSLLKLIASVLKTALIDPAGKLDPTLISALKGASDATFKGS